MPNSCPGCGCSNPADFDDSSGNIVCTQCGTVVNDSHIVSDITFGENSAGAATVQGSFVGAGQTRANTGSRYRSGTSIESREQTIAEGISRAPPPVPRTAALPFLLPPFLPPLPLLPPLLRPKALDRRLILPMQRENSSTT